MSRIVFKKTRVLRPYVWGAYDTQDCWKCVGEIEGAMIEGYTAITNNPDISSRHFFRFKARSAIRERAILPGDCND